MYGESRDDAYFLDAVTVLREIPGPASVWHQQMVQVSLQDPEAGPLKKPGKRAREDDAQFTSSVAAKLIRCRSEVASAAARTTFWDVSRVAVLLGQFEASRDSPTGSPNLHTFEIEFAATITRTYPRRWHRQTSPRRTFEATRLLQLIRRLRVLQHYADFMERIAEGASYTEMLNSEGYGGHFEVEFQALRGNFLTFYDYYFVSRIARRAHESRIPMPDANMAHLLASVFFDSWSPCIRAVRSQAQALNGSLWRILESGQLLAADYDLLTPRECQILARGSSELTVDAAQLSGLQHPNPKRDLLPLLEWTDDVDQPDNSDLQVLFRPIASEFPILRYHGKYHISLIHCLTTDLSRLLEKKLSQEIGEAYHDLRSQELEATTMAVLERLFVDSQSISGGYYWLTDKSESIEVDGVLAWRDILLIVEAKSGYRSLASHHGRSESVRRDLEKTISDGFYQACRLLKALDERGSITLRSRGGGSLELDRSMIRRSYVLLPTADAFGGVTTRMERLWANSVLPKGSLPLVIPVQDLMLVADVLETPIQTVAYLDYREELLAKEGVVVADELEILGAYVSGLDFIGRIEDGRRQFATHIRESERYSNKHHIHYIPPNQQERHLNPWILRAYSALSVGGGKPIPPSRHSAEGTAAVEAMFARTDRLESASAALQVERDVLEEVLRGVELPPGRPDQLGMSRTQTGFVYYRRGPINEVRRRTNEIRRDSRHVLYVRRGAGVLELTFADRGGRHTFKRDDRTSLTAMSRLGEYDHWFAAYQARRKAGKRRTDRFDPALIESLVTHGLPRDQSIGIARGNLYSHVLALVGRAIPINRAADFCLQLPADLKSSVVLDAAGIAASCIELASSGRIHHQTIIALYGASVSQTDRSVEETAADMGILLETESVSEIQEKLNTILKDLYSNSLPVPSSKKARDKLTNRALGKLRQQSPNTDLGLAAKLLAKRLEEEVE